MQKIGRFFEMLKRNLRSVGSFGDSKKKDRKGALRRMYDKYMNRGKQGKQGSVGSFYKDVLSGEKSPATLGGWKKLYRKRNFKDPFGK